MGNTCKAVDKGFHPGSALTSQYQRYQHPSIHRGTAHRWQVWMLSLIQLSQYHSTGVRCSSTLKGEHQPEALLDMFLQKSAGKPASPSADASGLRTDEKHEIGATQRVRFGRASCRLYVERFLTSAGSEPMLMMDAFTSPL